MKRQILVVAVLTCAVALQSIASTAPLKGCITRHALAANLKIITARDWNQIGEKQLQAIWTSELGGIDCKGGACNTMGRKDRVIKDECDCCELFQFSIVRDNNGNVTSEHLHNIVVYYSRATRKELLDDARVLASAMGLKTSDAGRIDFKVQDFNWTIKTSNPKQVVLLNTRLYHHGSVWTAYFLLSRQPL